ncbi:MAG: transposase [Paracoccus sp. (in: a-proteobacteria)]
MSICTVSVPLKLTIPDLMRKIKGRSSYRVQRECPHIRKHYWGVQVLGQGLIFNHQRTITEDIVLQDLENHIADPTGASR